MDAYDCIATKLDVREFNPTRNVPADFKAEVLEAARLTGSSKNTQHWRFILVQTRQHLRKLAEDSTTGKWVAAANFAVMVLTEEKQRFQLIDAGRVTQNMQLAAWNHGVVSCVFTNMDQNAIRRDFQTPENYVASIVIGFGYPFKKISGKRKNRKPLHELAYLENFGTPFNKQKL